MQTAIQHKAGQLQRQLHCIMKALFNMMSTSCFHFKFPVTLLFVFLSKFLSSTLFFSMFLLLLLHWTLNRCVHKDNKQCFEWIKRQKETKKKVLTSLWLGAELQKFRRLYSASLRLTTKIIFSDSLKKPTKGNECIQPHWIHFTVNSVFLLYFLKLICINWKGFLKQLWVLRDVLFSPLCH